MRVVEVKVTATGDRPVPVVVQIETKLNDTWKVEKVHDLMTGEAQKKVLLEDNQRVVVYGPPTVEHVFDREQNASVAKLIEFGAEKTSEAAKELAKPSATTPVAMSNPATTPAPAKTDVFAPKPATTGTSSAPPPPPSQPLSTPISSPQTGGQSSKDIKR